jgi:hypothetical protein
MFLLSLDNNVLVYREKGSLINLLADKNHSGTTRLHLSENKKHLANSYLC